MQHPYVDTAGYQKACAIVSKYNISFGHYEGIDTYLAENYLICDLPADRPNLYMHKARTIADYLFIKKQGCELDPEYNANVGGVIFGLLFPENSTMSAIEKYGLEGAIKQCACLDKFIVANSFYKLTGKLIIPK